MIGGVVAGGVQEPHRRQGRRAGTAYTYVCVYTYMDAYVCIYME